MINLHCVLRNAKRVSLRATANLTPPTRAHHVIRRAESGLHIHLSHWSAFDGRRLAITPGADVVVVGHRSTSDAVELFVDPQLAL